MSYDYYIIHIPSFSLAWTNTTLVLWGDGDFFLYCLCLVPPWRRMALRRSPLGSIRNVIIGRCGTNARHPSAPRHGCSTDISMALYLCLRSMPGRLISNAFYVL